MTSNLIKYQELLENIRSHKAQESETFRHNVQAENLERSKQYETIRHNVALEGETRRSNLINESIKYSTLDQQERLASKGHLITEQQLAEQRRHNEATEEEAIRSNVAKEQENKRHNRTSEVLNTFGSMLGLIGSLARFAF